MDIRRTPAAAVRIPSYRDDAATPRSTSRSNSQTSDNSLRPREAMVIPGARFDDAPPPLPPPRYNEELAQGVDVAWSWGNSDPFSTKKRLAPINPGSSLYGGYPDSRRGLGRSRDIEDMDLDNDYPRRSSNVSTVRSPSQTEIRTGGHVPTLIRNPPSPTTANQRLVSHGMLCDNLNRGSCFLLLYYRVGHCGIGLPDYRSTVVLVLLFFFHFPLHRGG